MKCIDDELIQRYIDGETDSLETNRIEKHLADCSQCAGNVAEHKAFADVIKTEIGHWGRKLDIIPDFVAPNTRKHRLKLKIRHYIYAVSAACAVLLFVFIRSEQSGDEPNMMTVELIYGFEGDFDSNKTVSRQEMTLFMITHDGKVVEFN